MGNIHQMIMEFGSKTPSSATEVFAAGHDEASYKAALTYMQDEDTDTGFLFSGWAQAALPHKALADDQAWQVTTDRVTLVVEPGFRPGEDGNPVPVGVPYGSRARLILIYLQTEAVKTNSCEVEMGRSLHAWLTHMGIPIGGMQMRVIRDQAERLARCKLSFNIRQGNLTGIVNQNILDASLFSNSDDNKQRFAQKAVLSQSFFNELKKHPVRVEEAAIRACSNNPAALDVYCWLAYRLHVLQTPLHINWSPLHSQFGRSIARIDHFRQQFKRALSHALAVYPGAKAELDQKGITLYPSPPPVIDNPPPKRPPPAPLPVKRGPPVLGGGSGAGAAVVARRISVSATSSG